ncbi:MAG: HAD hydrolase family protein [Candidatus Thermoplasmatota archaeon]
MRAVAADYDRTLTTHDTLELVPEALDALRTLRSIGVKTIIVSGRSVDFLALAVGDVADAIVAENGCLLRTNEGLVTPIGGVAADLERALDGLDVETERGQVIVSFDLASEGLVREALERSGIRGHLVRNRDRVMLLPEGIDKAVGLLAALELVGVLPEHCVAFGDGENDIPMLRAVGRGVAVGNAAPSLQAVADDITSLPGGLGVAAWIRAQLTLEEAAP